MRKSLAFMFFVSLMISAFAGCSPNSAPAKGTPGSSAPPPSSEAPKAALSSAASAPEPSAPKTGTPKVYMTKHITPDGLMAVYNALGRKATGKVAVKLTVGEPGDTYYLSPKLIKKLVLSVKDSLRFNAIAGRLFMRGARRKTPPGS